VYYFSFLLLLIDTYIDIMYNHKINRLSAPAKIENLSDDNQTLPFPPTHLFDLKFPRLEVETVGSLQAGWAIETLGRWAFSPAARAPQRLTSVVPRKPRIAWLPLSCAERWADTGSILALPRFFSYPVHGAFCWHFHRVILRQMLFSVWPTTNTWRWAILTFNGGISL